MYGSMSGYGLRPPYNMYGGYGGFGQYGQEDSYVVRQAEVRDGGNKTRLYRKTKEWKGGGHRENDGEKECVRVRKNVIV